MRHNLYRKILSECSSAAHFLSPLHSLFIFKIKLHFFHSCLPFNRFLFPSMHFPGFIHYKLNFFHCQSSGCYDVKMINAICACQFCFLPFSEFSLVACCLIVCHFPHCHPPSLSLLPSFLLPSLPSFLPPFLPSFIHSFIPGIIHSFIPGISFSPLQIKFSFTAKPWML